MSTPIYTLYKTTNNINGKIYIGVHLTSNPNDSYLGSGKLLKRAINKYGKDSFKKEVLFTFENKSDAYQKETLLVNKNFIIDTSNYNLKEGGIGGLNENHILRGENHPWYGRNHTEESKEKNRQAHLGVGWSKESREKVSLSTTGKKNYKYKGDYITPWGSFHSTTSAVKSCPFLISSNSVEKWCKSNDIIITNKMYNGSVFLRNTYEKNIFGKSFNSLGFNFYIQ